MIKWLTCSSHNSLSQRHGVITRYYDVTTPATMTPLTPRYYAMTAPKVAMDLVVLPEEQKEKILASVTTYAQFKAYRKRRGLEETLPMSSGLVLLFR